jgi:hypothetical protein
MLVDTKKIASCVVVVVVVVNVVIVVVVVRNIQRILIAKKYIPKRSLTYPACIQQK